MAFEQLNISYTNKGNHILCKIFALGDGALLVQSKRSACDGMPIFYESNNFCTSSIVGGFSGNGKREIAIAEHALAKRTIWSSEKPFKSP